MSDQKTESNRLFDLVQRLRGEHGTEPWQVNPAAKIAADAIEAQAKRIKELEAALDKFHKDPNNPDAIVLRYKTIASKAINEQVELRSRVFELEAALKPFAEYTAWLDAHEYDPDDTIICFGLEDKCLTAGDCRQARKVLGEK